jgi:hypothetical protein
MQASDFPYYATGLVSILACIVAMFGISSDFASGKDSGEASPKLVGAILLLSCGGFLLGIMSFVAFTLMNFF